jgi:hypothetical protein
VGCGFVFVNDTARTMRPNWCCTHARVSRGAGALWPIYTHCQLKCTLAKVEARACVLKSERHFHSTRITGIKPLMGTPSLCDERVGARGSIHL